MASDKYDIEAIVANPNNSILTDEKLDYNDRIRINDRIRYDHRIQLHIYHNRRELNLLSDDYEFFDIWYVLCESQEIEYYGYIISAKERPKRNLFIAFILSTGYRNDIKDELIESFNFSEYRRTVSEWREEKEKQDNKRYYLESLYRLRTEEEKNERRHLKNFGKGETPIHEFPSFNEWIAHNE